MASSNLIVASLLATSLAIGACTPEQSARVHFAAAEDPAAIESHQANDANHIAPTISPAQESDEAVLLQLADYTEWRVVNEIRYRQHKSVSTLCRLPPPRCNAEQVQPMTLNTEELLALESPDHPPDAGIHVFVNSLAEEPMLAQRQPRFPEGSIIVKQKWHDDDQQTPDLLTVMIKREPGYNPDVGDWEFLAVAGDASYIQARGRLQNCQSCHIPRRDTDFIIRSYLPEHILAGLD